MGASMGASADTSAADAEASAIGKRVRDSEIVVTGTLESRELQKLKSPALGVSIDSEQIGAINTINTEDAIRYAPNLIVRKRYIGDANATLSFRNMHTTQTPRALVTVDGFLISDFLGASYSTAPKWAVLAPGDIARAEIIYGPTSARYSGNSLGGTLELVTREITENALRLNAQGFFQNYKYYDTDEDLYGYSLDAQADLKLDDRGGISFGYRHFENEGQPQQWRTVTPGTPYADQAIVDMGLGFPLRIAAQDAIADATEDQFRLRGNYDLGQGWTMRALAALLIDQDDTTNPKSFLRDESGAPTFIGISGITQGLSTSHELLTGLGLNGTISGWSVDLAASRFTLLKDRQRQSDPADVTTGIIPDSGKVTDDDAHWTALNATAERVLGIHSLSLGASYTGYYGNSETSATTAWRSMSDPVLQNASGGETELVGLFAEDALALTPEITATLGLRWEHWRAQNGFLLNGDDRVDYASRSDDAWSPKAALTWRPDAMTEFTASAAWATRFPTIGELYQASLISYGPNVGEVDLDGFNPDLTPEKGFDLQLTASRRIDNVKVTLSGYRQAVEDTLFSQSILIPSSDDPGTIVSQSLITNIGEVETWGIDLIVAAEDLILDGLDLDANLSWIDAKITENPLNPALVGNRFPRVPEWRANASLRYRVSDALDVAANVRHQNTPDRNIENNSSSRCGTYYCVSPFTFVDLKATTHLGAVDLSVGVDNLLDEKAFVFHPYPGRTVSIGLHWKGGL
ncbi:TonB-dependent receptor [Altererythrobacter endophyticus]|uniref:TonB-dependent receptor n=2 Tax=Altericroceibacterium endophyticum TaxID=1808508 RepID=A0A6I4T6D2_9SPHN|nr:TonB-dependent receptor [Altericroceibacterium endophyticum]